MHQSIDHDDAKTDALRRRIRDALANDLNFPAQHATVIATTNPFAVASRRQVPAVATTPGRSTAAPFDTWGCIVAHTYAFTAKS
jgi:hypothetical protein